MHREYNTKQKNEILKFIKENKEKNFTTDELYEGLKDAGINVGKTTVYRYLENLYINGYVRKFTGDDRSGACYQYICEECKEHYHLKCTVCGKIIHTDCEELNKIKKHFYEKHGFAIDTSKFILYGICKECLYEKENH